MLACRPRLEEPAINAGGGSSWWPISEENDSVGTCAMPAVCMFLIGSREEDLEYSVMNGVTA